MPECVQFWFEFASTYSYLSAMRIEEEASRRGVALRWRPFLLGPIFGGQGWSTSPFNLYPAKGRYMWRDMERRSEKLGIPFRRLDSIGPDAFPRHSLLAARMAIAVLDEPWGTEFCRRVYTAEFVDGLDIADPAVIDSCLVKAAGGSSGYSVASLTDACKAALRDNVEEAISLGIFGAPSFVVDGELFWGDDRLDDALDWAAT